MVDKHDVEYSNENNREFKNLKKNSQGNRVEISNVKDVNNHDVEKNDSLKKSTDNQL